MLYNIYNREVNLLDLYDYYKKYYELTKQQKEVINDNNIEGLNEIISAKQKIIQDINELSGIENYVEKQDDPKEAFIELKKLLKKTQQLEKENNERLNNEKNKIQENVAELNKKVKSRKGYLAQDKYEAKFIDKKS